MIFNGLTIVKRFKKAKILASSLIRFSLSSHGETSCTNFYRNIFSRFFYIFFSFSISLNVTLWCLKKCYVGPQEALKPTFRYIANWHKKTWGPWFFQSIATGGGVWVDQEKLCINVLQILLVRRKFSSLSLKNRVRI